MCIFNHDQSVCSSCFLSLCTCQTSAEYYMAAIRGRNYGPEELVQVCKSVLHISQDPIVDNGQRAEKYWERIMQHYEAHKPAGTETRARKSLEAKWGDIKHDVSKFIDVYKQVEDLQISGTNQEDTFVRAKELYKQNHPKGRSFCFDSCFWILKEARRWGNPNDEMTTKRKSPSQGESNGGNSRATSPTGNPVNGDGEGSDNIEQVVTESDSGPSQERVRPVGTKRAREEAKRTKYEQDAIRASLKAQEEWAATNSDRTECLMTTTILKLCTLPEGSVHPSMRNFIAEFRVSQAEKLAGKLMQRQQAAAAFDVQRSIPEQTPSSPPLNAATVGDYYTPEYIVEQAQWQNHAVDSNNDAPNDGLNLAFEL